MGRLFLTESGRMLLHANEEISRWRWARKLLRLPKTAIADEADLWLCVCGYPGNREPLDVRVNGRRVSKLSPAHGDAAGAWTWQRVKLARGTLGQGVNEMILTCDSRAMNAWMLAIENGHRSPASSLSTDSGKTWQSERMGACGVLRGEYLVRLRSHSPALRDRAVPPIVYEDAAHPRVRELLELLPLRIRRTRDPWKQVLALRTWVAQAWTYEAFGRNYAPWDAWTVLAWTRCDWGHGRANPIAMCVHYGMIFAALAAALGHRSRGLAVTQDINGPNGHFMAEIWDSDLQKWVAHDPNFDLHYEDGQPLSGVELADRYRARESTASDMRRGGGFTSRCPRLNGLLKTKLATGKSFNAMALWRRNNVVSDPATAPPSHGSVVYCETDLVWYAPGEAPIAPMFPYSTPDRDYFTRPPAPREPARRGAS